MVSRVQVKEQSAALNANRKQQTIIAYEIAYRDVTGKFPDYPDEEEGGSSLIFKNKSVKELENDLENMVRAISSL